MAKLKDRLAVSDKKIKELGTLYLYTIEFGVLQINNEKKIIGAGITACL